uniref:Uncharacterized protein n=1 Tax=Anguilla anguilla TaxID=7936 RepID=A0A0E9T273_ANGAN
MKSSSLQTNFTVVPMGIQPIFKKLTLEI